MKGRITAVVLAFVVTAGAPIGSASTDAAPSRYWQGQGCDHGHRGFVAKKRITLRMKHQNVLTRQDQRRVQHYTKCVNGVAQSRRLKGHVRDLRKWRKAHVCTLAHGTRALGKCMASRDYGWTGVQWGCLDELWGGRESGWDVYADNPTSEAYGIPQALPGWKMGPGWQNNAFVQIRWGLGYIAGRFGSPCGALDHHNSNGWY